MEVSSWKAKDLVGIWQWHKDEQEVGLLVETVEKSVFASKDQHLWKILDSEGKVIEVWECDLYPVGQAKPILLKSFTNVAFPAIRREVPKLIAQDILEVQPMTRPDSKILQADWNKVITETE